MSMNEKYLIDARLGDGAISDYCSMYEDNDVSGLVISIDMDAVNPILASIKQLSQDNGGILITAEIGKFIETVFYREEDFEDEDTEEVGVEKVAVDQIDYMVEVSAKVSSYGNFTILYESKFDSSNYWEYSVDIESPALSEQEENLEVIRKLLSF